MYKYIYALPDGTIQSMQFDNLYYLGQTIAYHHLANITPIQVNSSDGRLITDNPLTIHKDPNIPLVNDILAAIGDGLDTYFTTGNTPAH